MKVPLLTSGMALALLGGVATAAPAGSDWQIGPIIRGENRSAGMPLHPQSAATGWSFNFPTARSGHVNYLTVPTGPLVNKSRVVMRYRIVADPSVRLVPRESPGAPATLAFYFQRQGDSWTAKRQFEHYRWYATHSKRVTLVPGEHVISLTLEGVNWKSLGASTGKDAPTQFRDALANAERIGFVLGGGLSAGHGVYATGPARFELLSFDVE